VESKNRKILILLGAGHAHLQALLFFIKNRRRLKKVFESWEIYLITPQSTVLYSGKVPSVIAKEISVTEASIDLDSLAQYPFLRLKLGSVVQINSAENFVVTDSGERLNYNLLSINVGGTQPALASNNPESVFPVRPIDRFTEAINKILIKPGAKSIAIVGAGAVAIEIACALRTQGEYRIKLFTDKKFLYKNNPALSDFILKLLKQKNIEVITNFSVRLLNQSDGTDAHDFQNGTVTAGAFVLATPTIPALKFKHDLNLSPAGALNVDQYLKCSKYVFAQGDCAELPGAQIPKSGVQAVRQGKVLVQNLVAEMLGSTALVPFKANPVELNIFFIDSGLALLIWGNFYSLGAWVKQFKNFIDQKFLKSFKKSKYLDF
jgi:NADH dehydrogenase FAD-containing subunit